MPLSYYFPLDGLGGAMAWPSNNPKKTAHKKTTCGLLREAIRSTDAVTKTLRMTDDQDLQFNGLFTVAIKYHKTRLHAGIRSTDAVTKTLRTTDDQDLQFNGLFTVAIKYHKTRLHAGGQQTVILPL
ncbi:hypothetical protein Tco_0980723 [Tanacetum coccineum]